MDKRVTGVTIIVAGLLAVVALSGLQGRLTVGVAQHGPSVRTGECARLDPSPTLGDPSDILRTPVPVASWTECADPDAGTVIGSTDEAQLPETETPMGFRGLLDECRTPLQSYLFGLMGGDYSWDVTGTHLTFRPLTTVIAVPARAAAADAPGVCVLARPGDGDQLHPLAVDSARPGDALATCAASWTDETYISCDRPHRVEVMALVTDRRIRMNVDLRAPAGCASFLSLATGQQDPTFGGALQIHMDAVPADPAAPVFCGLEVADPGRQLTGSLVGIEDRPIPWL